MQYCPMTERRCGPTSLAAHSSDRRRCVLISKNDDAASAGAASETTREEAREAATCALALSESAESALRIRFASLLESYASSAPALSPLCVGGNCCASTAECATSATKGATNGGNSAPALRGIWNDKAQARGRERGVVEHKVWTLPRHGGAWLVWRYSAHTFLQSAACTVLCFTGARALTPKNPHTLPH